MPKRCKWSETDPLLLNYHDEEWGVPERDSRTMWAKLMLDGFQAGLSWLIILRRREAFYRAFRDFDPQVVARFGAADVKRLLADEGIIRSRAKIEATIGNARAFLQMQERGEDFSTLIWTMAGGKPIRNESGKVPAKTPLSEEISKALKTRRIQICRPGDRVCLDASQRHRERSRRGVFSAKQGARGERAQEVIEQSQTDCYDASGPRALG